MLPRGPFFFIGLLVLCEQSYEYDVTVAGMRSDIVSSVVLSWCAVFELWAFSMHLGCVAAVNTSHRMARNRQINIRAHTYIHAYMHTYIQT